MILLRGSWPMGSLHSAGGKPSVNALAVADAVQRIDDQRGHAWAEELDPRFWCLQKLGI